MSVDLRFPIGLYEYQPGFRAQHLEALQALPRELRAAVSDLNPRQLDTPYRDGGWTIRQVVHHLPDSHMNGYIRHRFALTEDRPVIKPYAEERWAELTDARQAPIGVSLQLLESIHQRWTALLGSIPESQWSREYVHPERGPMTLDFSLGDYAWHGRHHLAHITSLRARMNW
jgi:hypothetical protein